MLGLFHVVDRQLVTASVCFQKKRAKTTLFPRTHAIFFSIKTASESARRASQHHVEVTFLVCFLAFFGRFVFHALGSLFDR